MKITIHDPLEPGEYDLTLLVPEPPVEPEPPPVDPVLPWLAYRVEPDSEPLPLDGATVSGSIYVTCETPDPQFVSSVSFTGAHTRTENSAPYSLTGDDAGVLRPWDTEALADGETVLTANVLGAGTLILVATFTIDNVADTTDPEEPPPPVEEPTTPPPNAVASLQRFETTWDFTAPVVSGVFANGDPWVLPSTVAEAWPKWDGSRGGSQINVVGFGEGTTGPGQGLDSILARWNDGLRARFPLALSAGQSLLTTWSWRLGEPGCPPDSNSRPGSPRPTIRWANVLTCLADVPPPGSLRPPYAGTAKPMLSTATLIDLDTLPKWPIPAGAPSVVDVLSRTERVWLDHREKWHSRFFRPDNAMDDYGRDLAANLGDAILFLLLDIPIPDKRKIAIHIAQIAVDQRGVFETGLIFGRDGGGISVGHHGPLVIAGHLFQDASLRDYFVGKDIKLTQERSQIAEDAQGIYWRNHDKVDRATRFDTGYERCCTINGYIGHVLAVRALGLEAAWAHPLTFMYADEYMADTHSMDFHYGWHSWHRDLWIATNGGRNAP